VTATDIVIRLPLPLDVAVRVMRAVDREWPGALAVTEHDHGEEVLVLRVDDTSPTHCPICEARTDVLKDGDCGCQTGVRP